MKRFIAIIGAKPLCPVHAHMVYFGSNHVYVLLIVRPLQKNVLSGLELASPFWPVGSNRPWRSNAI